MEIGARRAQTDPKVPSVEGGARGLGCRQPLRAESPEAKSVRISQRDRYSILADASSGIHGSAPGKECGAMAAPP